jgi:DNA-3-methyladenine glycosylase II
VSVRNGNKEPSTIHHQLPTINYQPSTITPTIHIPIPTHFRFSELLHFLRRSPKEILHRVYEDDSVMKLIPADGAEWLCRASCREDGLQIEVLNGKPGNAATHEIIQFIRQWFDMDTDLAPFYRMAKKDALLGPLVKKYAGYRIVSMPSLFESLTWAIIGQQINLGFAYTLKQRLVEDFGTSMQWKAVNYYTFPRPETLAELSATKLTALQFSRSKASYIINVAEAFCRGDITQQAIAGLSFDAAKEKMMQVKGIGNWTANYALMKTFRYPNAFPLEDAGLHNALKQLLGMEQKPSLTEIKNIFECWKGWEAYATLYLWRSLGD